MTGSLYELVDGRPAMRLALVDGASGGPVVSGSEYEIVGGALALRAKVVGGSAGSGGISQAQLDEAIAPLATTTALNNAIASEAQARAQSIAQASQISSPWLPSGPKARVYVIFGQSNAAGSAPIGDFSSPLRATRARTYTRVGSWGNPSFALFQPGVNNRSAPNEAGFDLQLSLDLEAAYPSDTIYLINLSWGGTSLDVDWNPDVGFFFQSFVFELRQAFKKLPPNAVLCGFLWNQGEGEAVSPANARYKSHLAYLVNRLRRLFGFCPFLAGRIQQGGSGVGPRTAVQELANELPLFDWIDQDGLPFEGTNVHYLAGGYNTIGSRYASKLISLNCLAPIQRAGELTTTSKYAHFQSFWEDISALPCGLLIKASAFITGSASAAGNLNFDLFLFTSTDVGQAVFHTSTPISVGNFQVSFQIDTKAFVRRDIKFYRVRLFPTGGAALTYSGAVHLITEI